MKITKRQLRRIIKEELLHEGGAMGHYEPQKKRSYHQISDSMKSMANAAKRKFLKLYDAKVRIDGREGWITVNGKKAVNISSASGRPLSMHDMLDQMEDTLNKE
jgi:hypothetical protein